MQLTEDQIKRLARRHVSSKGIGETIVVGGSSNDRSSGYADIAKRAYEADHAKSAATLDDGSTTLQEIDKKYLSKEHDDTAQGIIDFLKGIKIGGRPLSELFLSKEHDDTAQGVIDFLKGIKIGGRPLSELFLSKEQDDTAEGIIDFLKGIKIGGKPLSELFLSKEHDDTAEGNIDFKKNVKVDGQITGDSVQSTAFNSGMQDGVGFKLIYDGKESWLEIDKLTVRMRAIFQALEIRKAEFSAGNLNLTGAGARIVAVADVDADGKLYNGYPERFFSIGGTWVTDNQLALYVTDKTASANATIKARRCYFEADDGERRTHNLFHVGDMVMCQTFNVAEGVYDGVRNKYYWRTCVRTGDAVQVGDKVYHYIDLYTDDNDNTVSLEYNGAAHDVATKDPNNSNDYPGADEVVQLGNFFEAERQNAISLVAVGNAPKIALYANICDYTRLSDRCVLLLCPTGSYINTKYLYLTTDMSKTLADVLAETDDAISDNKKGISDLVVAKNGITTRVANVEGRMTTAETNITQNADSITATASDLGGRISSLEQTAGRISMHVSDMLYGTSHNLLYDTGFYRPLWTYADNAYKDNVLMAYGIRHREVMNNGDAANDANINTDWSVLHDGSASVLAGAEGLTADAYLGLRYNVPVTAGQTYTVSVWVMTYDVSKVDGGIGVEMHYSTAAGARDITGGSKYGSLKPSANGTWQRMTLTMQAPATAKYLEFCFFVSRNGWVYFSQPQAEAGESATDWALNELDMMQRAGLDIREGEIDLSAERTKITDQYGETVALFADGKIQARYIDAETVVARGIYSQTIDCGNATFSNVSVTGVVNANGGKIGGFNITQSSIGDDKNRLTLNPYSITFRDTDNSTYAYTAYMGSQNIPLALGSYDDTHYNVALQLGAGQRNAGTGSVTDEAGKSYKPMNMAVQALSGCYAGFRRQVLSLRESAEILAGNNAVVSEFKGKLRAMSGAVLIAKDGVANMQITLPYQPEDGTEYYFVKAQSNNFDILGNGGEKIYTHGNTVSSYNVGQYNTIRLTYYAGVWYLNYLNS